MQHSVITTFSLALWLLCQPIQQNASVFFSAKPEEKRLVIPEEITFKRKNFNKNNPSELFKLFISYPEAEGMDAEQQHEINLGIQRLMTEAIADFKQEMRKLQNRSSEITYGVLNFDYLIVYNSDKMVSVQFQNDTDFGERYGKKQQIHTFNYNISAKRGVNPVTIFSKEADVLKELYSILKEKAENFKPDPKGIFDKFNVTEEHIVFYFDVTNSNKKELNEVRVSWAEIEHLLAEGSDVKVLK